MSNPNNEVAKSVGQGGASQDMTQEYDKRHGAYSMSKGGKTASPGPGSLPNTPGPFKLKG